MLTLNGAAPVTSYSFSLYKLRLIGFSSRLFSLRRSFIFSADIRPAAHVALAITIAARRDDRSVRFQAYRVCFARRDSDDIPPAAHVASAILIPARRGNRSVRF